ncbi:putative Fe-Mo cluster-binding NifX family protein [Acetoanaerobium pronyense]|uniref:Fe-Mo cluster-binding NifX family protein n=1 Tax=Acetoanaerobium pronyense TaxID=1482736 RepID=A0ABS4KG72_9FIRM|nr:NifB/NifX family molybdenum-iron cluster-binding protein [Acetoanaerobium pronyense]MBP2026769.1 putative Fe-Mo cluster-binding NifX family protein [Acetoanaerobium pronyense]
MKIAVASDFGEVTSHFGHCREFEIFNVKENTIVEFEIISNPGHKPGFLPNFLNDIGVNVIISGGMGQGAIEIFNEKDIKVITGAQGKSKEAASMYISGNLISNGAVCNEHMNHGNC